MTILAGIHLASVVRARKSRAAAVKNAVTAAMRRRRSTRFFETSRRRVSRSSLLIDALLSRVGLVRGPQ